MSDEPQPPREYWIAIRPSMQSTINVFGPYALDEAATLRAEWRRDYPPSAMISAVFHADSRHQANQHASFYMPK